MRRARRLGLVLSLLAVSFGGAAWGVSRAITGTLTDRVRNDVSVRALLLAREAARWKTLPKDAEGWRVRARALADLGKARVTLLDPQGEWLADSEGTPAGRGNLQEQAEKEEVREAARGGVGWSVRMSLRLNRPLLHVAVPIVRAGRPAGFVRLVVPLAEVEEARGILRWGLGAAAAGSLAALLLFYGLGRPAAASMRQLVDAADRMAGGDFSTPPFSPREDGMAPLARALDRLARSLAVSIGSLRTERDLLRRVLGGMQEGVLLLDAEDRVAWVNPGLRALLPIPEGIEGRPLLEVVRLGELQALLDRSRVSRSAAQGEIETSGLRPRRLWVRVLPLEGDPPSWLFVWVDVTEVRRLETLRRDFVANVSHELRTPVTAIRSAAETLRGGAAHEPAALDRFMAIIDRNAERLQRLVEDLLDLSRIESREFRLDLQPVALGLLVSRVLALFHEAAVRAGVRVSSEVAPEVVLPRGDPQALEQILSNLVDNAIKYAGRGTSATVRSTRLPGGLRVEVADTGPGIEARHLPRLFERFYRVDAGRSRDLGGTGLGLSIVKHLVAAMGGTVEVESAPGRGSVFSFTLPTG